MASSCGVAAVAGAPSSPYRMVSVDEAVAVALSFAKPLAAVTLPLAAAHGRVLALDVQAAEPQPAFRASVKDGFAVRCADGAGEFPVAAASRAAARDGPPAPLQPGTVAYITTGAPVPEGADAVVQVENTVALEPGAPGEPPRRVRIAIAASRPGEDVRAIGSDVAAGERVLSAGDRLGAAELGLLASCGVAQVAVHPAPRVALLSTGDELVDAATPRDAMRHGAVRDANRPMLLAAVADAGAESLDLGLAADDAGGLAARLDAALQAGAHVLVTSGGVSMGDRDLVKPLLEARGAVHYGRVHMKPGKPLTFATVPSAVAGQPPLLVFGLPGNPVSALVTFQLVCVPVLRALAGWRQPGLRRVAVRTTAPLRLDPERPEYHRAALGWAPGAAALEARSTGAQASSRLLSARSAGVLLELPAKAGTLPAGTLVSALLIADAGAADGLVAVERIDPTPAAPQPAAAATPAQPIIGVITVSDRASAGVYEDVSGPAIVAVLRDYLATPCDFRTRVIPDERPLIAAALRDMAAAGACLVCTTGGTGPALRDVTPEAMEEVCDKMLAGFGEAMRAASLAAGVPTAILSRQAAGTVGRTLVVNVPGKPAAVRTCLDAVWPAIPYCIDLLEGPFLEGKPGAVPVFRPQKK